jgi:antitoxin PrlF
MPKSRICQRGRTTIPAPVREALSLAPGDCITYRIKAGRVVITRADAPVEDPFATFAEWASDADTAGYAGL